MKSSEELRKITPGSYRYIPRCLCLLLLYHARGAVLQDAQQFEDPLATAQYFGSTLRFVAASDVEAALHWLIEHAAELGDEFSARNAARGF